MGRSQEAARVSRVAERFLLSHADQAALSLPLVQAVGSLPARLPHRLRRPRGLCLLATLRVVDDFLASPPQDEVEDDGHHECDDDEVVVIHHLVPQLADAVAARDALQLDAEELPRELREGRRSSPLRRELVSSVFRPQAVLHDLFPVGPARNAPLARALDLRAAGMQQLLHLRRGDRELQAVQVGHGYVRVLPVAGPGVPTDGEVGKRGPGRAEHDQTLDAAHDPLDPLDLLQVLLQGLLGRLAVGVQQAVLVLVVRNAGVHHVAGEGGRAHYVDRRGVVQLASLLRLLEVQEDPRRRHARVAIHGVPHLEAHRLVFSVGLGPIQHLQRADPAEAELDLADDGVELEDPDGERVLQRVPAQPQGEDLREVDRLRVSVLGHGRGHGRVALHLHGYEEVSAPVKGKVAHNYVLQLHRDR
mmetsp:Transcript_687/g.2176  ORF Transcript_687/g.2176 Transcript_687/m.2176 type:complete len:418 (-) Transcript_687:468-1721(-)